MKTLEYRRPVAALTTGSSLGNLHAFARLDECSDLLGLWSPADNQFYVGSWSLRIRVDGTEARATETVFRAASQTTSFDEGAVHLEKTFFVPVLSGNDEDAMRQRAAILEVKAENRSGSEVKVALEHLVIFPAVSTTKFSRQPDQWEREKVVGVKAEGSLCIATTEGNPRECRVFGSDHPCAFMRIDKSAVTAVYEFALASGTERSVAFRLTFSPHGLQEAVDAFHALADVPRIRDASIRSVHERSARAFVVTPDPVVNRGLRWAKIGMDRVRHRFKAGEAFTNDPPQDIVVMRDLAWYTLGMDFLDPLSSRAMLDLVCSRAIHEGGKVTEFLHANETRPEKNDYGLNINDDTPLVLWALAHHGWVTGDEQFMRRVYPCMKLAAEWILRQRRDGLVFCTAAGTNVRGICSWRNIIDRYTLSGAVTEINAECAHALRLTAQVANDLGFEQDAATFSGAAAGLIDAIRTNLVSDRTGVYLLNIDIDGVKHHDVTGDLIFPVLCGVADDAMRTKIVQRLTQPDFWTDYGARTVPPGEWNYDPDADYQLRGGVWPNLTAWIAYGARSLRPSLVAEALHNIHKIVEADQPEQFGALVPGELPERLHGEDFRSRGMTLSPWAPPTYFWLGIEGLLGLSCTLHGIEVNPAVPADWPWLAVKHLRIHGQNMSLLLYEGTLYTSVPVTSALPVRVGKELPVRSDVQGVFVLAMEAGSEVVLFASGPRAVAGRIAYELHGRWEETVVAFGETGAYIQRIRQGARGS
ncbi:MAG TPA: hypothetical protein VMG09_08290 [Bacteroidota bacterium]|nr:hypothetical protein [Bacteroidota bacterium]